MVSRFERSGRANYLVLCTEQKEEKMADRMLLRNEMKGLLPVRIERMNGCKEYYYNISSKHSLGSIVKKGSLDAPKIRILINTIGEILKQFHEYMLEPDGICLSEELIYTTLPEWNLLFCYYEEEEKKFSEKLRKLLQFIIEYVDYQDKEAVSLAYACYQAAMQENFTFAKIEECLYKNKKVEKEEEKKITEVVADKKISETDRQQIGVQLAAEPRVQSEIMEEEVEESSFDSEKAKQIFYFIIGGGCLVTGALWLFVSEGIWLEGVAPIYIIAFGAGLTLMALFVWIIIKKQWKEKTKLVTKKMIYPFDPSKQEDNLEYRQQQNFVENKGQEFNSYENKRQESNSCENKVQESNSYEKTVLLSYRIEEEHRTLFSCQKEYPSIEILEYPCSIGKIPAFNQAVIAHEGISRIHCSIQRENDSYTITDRNSTNGVIVNGRHLLPNETVELPIESEIVLGILRYIFR